MPDVSISNEWRLGTNVAGSEWSLFKLLSFYVPAKKITIKFIQNSRLSGVILKAGPQEYEECKRKIHLNILAFGLRKY
jgi:hypothetical protein